MGARADLRSERLGRLSTALACDVLDALGVRNAFLGPAVRQLSPAAGSPPAPACAGRAITLTCRATDGTDGDDREPYGVLFEALADHHPGSVLVIAAGDAVSGVWGELLSVAARARGVEGVVTDGLVRDLAQIVEVGFAVHGLGVSPLDSAGRQDFASLGDTVTIGGVDVHPDDWMLADELGAVAIPGDLVDRVIELAEDKSSGERTVRSELEAGEDLGVVFRRHGIL